MIGGCQIEDVDIETEWNLKYFSYIYKHQRYHCRYRNRVEFKDFCRKFSLCHIKRRYRNRVEFKVTIFYII